MRDRTYRAAMLWAFAATLAARPAATFTVWDTYGPFTLDTLTGGRAPELSAIPGQTVERGTDFTPIELDACVNDPDGSDAAIVWTVSGDQNLAVDIVARIATISPRDADWVGSETLLFRATDADGLYAEGEAVFTSGVGFDLILDPGWNLIALPVHTDRPVAEIMTGLAMPYAWGWSEQGNYERVTVLTPRRGCWVLHLQGAVVRVVGLPVAGTFVALWTGWNLVGAAVPPPFPAQPLDAASLFGPGQHDGICGWGWGWEGYLPTTGFSLGAGYWFYVPPGRQTPQDPRGTTPSAPAAGNGLTDPR